MSDKQLLGYIYGYLQRLLDCMSTNDTQIVLKKEDLENLVEMLCENIYINNADKDLHK